MKACRKCGRRLELSWFYKHPCMKDGHLNYCKECVRDRVNQRYKTKREWVAAYERDRSRSPLRRSNVIRYQKTSRERNPEKWAARIKVRRAIQSGVLQRLPCAVCGNVKSQAHHEDYSKPLDVKWLCFRHHREAHGQVVVSDYV